MKKFLLWALFIYCLYIISWMFMEGPHGANYLDFAVYFEGAQKALHHHTLYDITHHFQYKYSPFTGLVFSVLFYNQSFSEAQSWYYQTTFFLWIIYLLLMITFFTITHPKKSFQFSLFQMSLVSLFLFFYNPLSIELSFGQINIIPLSCLALAFLYPFKKTTLHLIIQSFLLCIAIQFKLYCGIALFYFLFQKNYKVLIFTFIHFLWTHFGILGLYSGFDFSWHEFVDWLATLSKSTDELLDSKHNISILGLFRKIGFSKAVCFTLWTPLLGLWLWSYKRMIPFGKTLSFLYVFTGVLLFNPLVWYYWVIMLIPAFLYIIVYLIDHWRDYTQKNRFLALGAMILFFFIITAQHSFYNRLIGMPILVLGLIWFFQTHALQDKRIHEGDFF